MQRYGHLIWLSSIACHHVISKAVTCSPTYKLPWYEAGLLVVLETIRLSRATEVQVTKDDGRTDGRLLPKSRDRKQVRKCTQILSDLALSLPSVLITSKALRLLKGVSWAWACFICRCNSRLKHFAAINITKVTLDMLTGRRVRSCKVSVILSDFN
jgi:hypothetical protein